MTDHRAPFALGTFSAGDGAPFAALVVDDRVWPLRDLARESPIVGMSQLLDDWERNFDWLRRVANGLGDAGEGILLAGLRVHPPVRPRQILCTGANYRKHVIDLLMEQGGGAATEGLSAAERRAQAEEQMDERAENGEPYAFPKVISSVTGPYDPVILPERVREPDWELELGVVIGRPARYVSRDDALDYVAGYTIVNDVTARDFVYRTDIKALGTDWIRGKGLPTFMPVGPYLIPAAFVPDPQDLQITLKLNGKVMQDESTGDMIFDVARQIEYLSAWIELYPGDIISTGSPSGNGHFWNRFLRPGDLMEGTITGLGEQRNECVREVR